MAGHKVSCIFCGSYHSLKYNIFDNKFSQANVNQLLLDSKNSKETAAFIAIIFNKVNHFSGLP